MSEQAFGEALEDLAAGGAPGGVSEPIGEAADASSHPSVAALEARFGEAIQQHRVMAGDEHVVWIAAPRIAEILRWLQSDPGQRYDYLADLTAVDWGGGRPLEVVYQLWSIPHRRALRVKAALPLSDLEIDSVCGIWNTANWLERETWDMFGIRFRGHPDLRRILMPDSYAEGYPLRKDFPLRGRFTRAEQTRQALAIPVEDDYSADELKVMTDVQEHGRVARERAAGEEG
jgi:NADH-quinone oxidoreductase subunit C